MGGFIIAPSLRRKLFQPINITMIASTLFYHLLTVLGFLLTGFLVATVLQQKRPPSTSLAWVMFIIFMPYLAVPLYLTLGSRKLHHYKLKQKEQLFGKFLRKEKVQRSNNMDRLLDSFGVPPALGGNQINLHNDGACAKQALLEVIDNARQQIDICAFILANDVIGRKIMERLEARAHEGIRIRLLLDGVGSFLLPDKSLRPLLDAGIEVVHFVPVLHRPFKGRTNLRNHRKLILADGVRGWSGGRNLAEEYFEQWRGGLPWIDLSFDIVGPAAVYYQNLFDADWNFATRSGSPIRSQPLELPEQGTSIVRVLPSGPDVNEDPLQALLLSACFEANERILLVTPYYVPDDALQEALCLAVRRGVQVDMVLPGRSNHRLADLARCRYLRELQDTGAHIHIHPQRMIHAKAMLFDEKLALCGSANLDIRSLYLNFESMTLFYSAREIRWLSDWIHSLKDDCHPMTTEPPGSARRLIEGAALLFSFQL